jgi:hypothetical protein
VPRSVLGVTPFGSCLWGCLLEVTTLTGQDTTPCCQRPQIVRFSTHRPAKTGTRRRK